MVLTSFLGTGLILLLTMLGLGGSGIVPLGEAALLGFALSFSSTVLVVKTLEERGETRSLYGRTAIGILVIQDIFAVIFMALTGEHLPSPWALLLVLLIPARWLLGKGLTRVGHSELLVLYGVVLAFVPGYWLFDLVGIKGDLGALIIGMLIATHPKSNELSRVLFSLKEFMLIGFFVSIGLSATPTLAQVGFAIVLLILLPINTVIYAGILRLTGLSPRTSTLASFTLTNFSEFCIIICVIGASTGLVSETWVVPFSIAVSLSFVVSTVLNMRGSKLPRWFGSLIPLVPEDRMHPEERPIDLGTAQAVVLGMGRIGRRAYDQLADDYQFNVIGVDNSEFRVENLQSRGYNVLEADASDAEFWKRLKDDQDVELVVLAMPSHGVNVEAYHYALEAKSECAFAAVAQYVDEYRELKALGIDKVINVYDGAGETLAEHAYDAFIEMKRKDAAR
ncbi:cation:proton antiporter family protein [Rothia terrae]|uniref:cation:proton antiporter family protein n=1 Tax=Rothia terrae TaxID=396015 RepID=UPI0033D67E05